MRRPRQLEFRFRTWGGRRKGAGRRAGPGGPGVPHRTRPPLHFRHPVHVTLRVVRGLPRLRYPDVFGAIRVGFRGGRDRFGFRLVHYSVQKDHLHLLAEARDRIALSRGMRGLAIRIAKSLNRALERHGRVFADRYHARALKTPREVRNALVYVLNNARRHAARRGLRYHAAWRDPYSTATCFPGWRNLVPRESHDAAGVVPAETWLLGTSWRRRGPLDPAERPPPEPDGRASF